jgi:hypothetical protein
VDLRDVFERAVCSAGPGDDHVRGDPMPKVQGLSKRRLTARLPKPTVRCAECKFIFPGCR